MPPFTFLNMIITNVMNSPVQDQDNKPVELCLVIFGLDYMNSEVSS